MSEEQNNWEKEREERELQRWRWETSRKFALILMQMGVGGGGRWLPEGLAKESVDFADAIISELKKEQP